jgi:hypothetical protein
MARHILSFVTNSTRKLYAWDGALACFAWDSGRSCFNQGRIWEREKFNPLQLGLLLLHLIERRCAKDDDDEM